MIDMPLQIRGYSPPTASTGRWGGGDRKSRRVRRTGIRPRPATTDAYPVTVTIPADAECGEHTMQATGPGVDESTEFTVAGDCVEPGSTGGSDLPRTGVEIGGALAIGLGLIAIGYAAVRGRRGRTAA